MPKRTRSPSPATRQKKRASTASSAASPKPQTAIVIRSDKRADLYTFRSPTCSSSSSLSTIPNSTSASSASSAAGSKSQSQDKLHNQARESHTASNHGSDTQSPSTLCQSSESTQSITANNQKSKEKQCGSAEIIPTAHTTAQCLQLSLQSKKDDVLVPKLAPATTKLTSSSLSLVTCNGPDAFPLFQNGDVIITSKRDAPYIRFQLHSDILIQHSAWFRNSFNINPREHYSTWYAYSIETEGDKVQLVRRDIQGDYAIIHNNGRDISTEPILKVEQYPNGELSDNTNQTTAECERPIASTELPNELSPIGLCQQVLATFYNIRPQMCDEDIGITLVQAERLTKIAKELGCLNLIRADISFALSQYGKKLFLSIKFDPPRWICLAIALEDGLIYKEALIHLVGAHPKWPWRHSKRAMLPPDLHQLIAKKSKVIDQMCLEAERDLLMLTIEVGGKPVSCEHRKAIETWVLVQIFRDEVAAILRSQQGSDKWPLVKGKLYRKLHRGGSAYMDYERTLRRCTQIFSEANWRDLGDDLNNLKEYVSAIVEKLAKNELMIDPEADNINIGYLTCVDVQKEDVIFSWCA